MKPSLLLPVLVVLALPAFAESTSDPYIACLTQALAEAGATTTVGELRKQCKEKMSDLTNREVVVVEASDAPDSVRMREEMTTEEDAFVITPHLPNYILLAAHNSAGVNEAPFHEQFPDEKISFDNTETKFQISFKFPVVKSIFGKNGDLYAAYTNRSFWQMYNSKESAPFRETNHQPELWLRFYSGREFWGFRNLANDIGIVHQSNGRSGSISRSWNRIYARFLFEKGNLAFSIQPWYRIPEDEDDDDNPDIEDYLGNFEFQSAYKWGAHEFGLMFRNNLDCGENHGAVQLDWSFPLYEHLRGYVQWFNGYGESLIDYNANVNSIGAGIKLTDWL